MYKIVIVIEEYAFSGEECGARYLNRIIKSVEIIFNDRNGDYSQVKSILSTKPEGGAHLTE
jgi:hypothetical protein